METGGVRLAGLSNQRKRLALLVHVTSAGSAGVSRDKLLACLWSERDADQARNALSQMLFALRRELGVDVIIGNGELAINAELLSSDVSEFRRAFAEGRHEDAVALYTGPFLDGFFVRDAPEFERWAEEQRALLAADYARALEQLATRAAEAGDTAHAVEWCRRRAALDPVAVRPALAYMEALLAHGDRPAAIRYAGTYATLLRTELGTEPDDLIADFLARARSASTTAAHDSSGVSEVRVPQLHEVTGDAASTGEAGDIVRHAKKWTKRTTKLALGIVAAVALSSVVAAWTVRDRSPEPLGALPEHSIAVLPFTNMSAQPDNQYFSDGITEDLITQLTTIRALRVVPRTSTQRYQGTTKSASQIARELGVSTLLEGSVRKEGNRVRVVAQLVNPAEERHLWAGTYDRDVSEIFAVQSEIAGSIVTALRAQLSPAERARLQRIPTARPTAHDYYLRGLAVLRTADQQRDTLLRDSSFALFTKAVETDPSFASAHAQLALVFWRRWARSGYRAAWFDSAVAEAKQAIEHDPSLPEGHRVLAGLYQWKGWLTRAAESARTALLLNPNHGEALALLGVNSFFLGRHDESLSLMHRLASIAPDADGNPSAISAYNIGKNLFVLDDLRQSEAWARKSILLVPNFAPGHTLLARTLVAQNRLEEAKQVVSSVSNGFTSLRLAGDLALVDGDFASAQRSYELALQQSWPYPASVRNPPFPVAVRNPGLDYGWFPITGLAYALIKQGHRQRALDLLSNELAARERRLAEGDEHFAIRYDLAAIQAIRGNKPEAYRWLEDAIAHGFRSYRMALLDPKLESLRNDERFQRLMNGLESRVAKMRQRAQDEAKSLL